MNIFDFLNDGMSEEKFEQRLHDAFENHLPIADKVNELRKDLNDTQTVLEIVAQHLDKTLTIASTGLFYQQCKLHCEVVKSYNYVAEKTTPIKNTQLWQDSVAWLMVYYEDIFDYAQEDERFFEIKQTPILWYFKWVVSNVVENYHVRKEQIDNYLKLLEYYYTYVFALGQRSLYKSIVMQGIKRGDCQLVEMHLDKWINAEENDFDDCWACQVDDIIRAYVFLGEHDKALEWSEQILNGSVKCGEVPHVTNSLIAQAYFYTNQIDKTKELLGSGYKLVKGQGQFIRPIAEFMRVAILLGDVDKAVQIYQDSRHLFDQCESLFQKMLFTIEASKLDIPEKSTLLTEARRLAQDFDKRNENDYYTLQLPMLYS
ncbi:hypothetical protein IM753_11315 [Moraxella sp. K127]|uniref:hypothetical protein n=1 Tax=Moraxella sp. K127 TaxID=2780079 RepID=UPI0018806FE4|nr:hypothetical protein [Moraxella sp. K127]MBE9591542.1 hypothetical protein [Moraxella sp. K127]